MKTRSLWTGWLRRVRALRSKANRAKAWTELREHPERFDFWPEGSQAMHHRQKQERHWERLRAAERRRAESSHA